MFRLRACTEDIANFALFAEAFAANSYLWMIWLEQRRRNKQPLNSGDEFPNTANWFCQNNRGSQGDNEKGVGWGLLGGEGGGECVAHNQNQSRLLLP